MTTARRNIIELREIREETENISDVVEAVNEAIVEINYILRSLTLANLDGEIKTVTIPASSVGRISHRLKIVPKYRIVLKQVGGSTILDGRYTRNYIELENTGITDTTLTLMIVKD